MSLSAPTNKANNVGEFVEMLSLMADPVRFNEKIAELKAATEDAAVQINLLVPADEIQGLRAAAAHSAAAAKARAEDLSERVSIVVAEVKDAIAHVVGQAAEQITAAENKARELIVEAERHNAAAIKDAEATKSKLTAIIDAFVKDAADATAAKAAADKMFEDAAAAKAAAEEARADFLARMDKLKAIAGE